MAANHKKDENEKQDDKQKQSGGGRKSGNGRRRGQRARENESNEQNAQQESGNGQGNNREEPRELEPAEVFDPISATRIATLRLARNWRYGGNTYGAMHAYERILAKYGGTPAAHAAAEELIAMAGELEREGKFYTALNIFNKVEEYYEPIHGDRYDPPRPTRYGSRHRRSSR